MDRITFYGHDNIYALAAATPSEKRRFRRVNAAYRPYMIAFLHCAHKPGCDLLSNTRGAAERSSLICRY